MSKLEYLEWLKREMSNGFYTIEQLVEKVIDVMIEEELAFKKMVLHQNDSLNP